MEAKVPTLFGMISGFLMNAFTGDIVKSLLVALATGSAAYIGQQITKWAHQKLKKNDISSKGNTN